MYRHDHCLLRTGAPPRRPDHIMQLFCIFATSKYPGLKAKNLYFKKYRMPVG
ncbi:hypothetical protein Salmuc_01077 [Salipiger mucosus DSM 16094]|uniref:Uncharacterized protein n=1 Tax=Salipiger mucosus DSM 16094 TaxID=1123237 RepID=S9QUU2_9RHOB|nr:hypothetical protein Salmuc_01077 [Salipiger mucosus DSM 16094]